MRIVGLAKFGVRESDRTTRVNNLCLPSRKSLIAKRGLLGRITSIVDLSGDPRNAGSDCNQPEHSAQRELKPVASSLWAFAHSAIIGREDGQSEIGFRKNVSLLEAISPTSDPQLLGRLGPCISIGRLLQSSTCEVRNVRCCNCMASRPLTRCQICHPCHQQYWLPCIDRGGSGNPRTNPPAAILRTG